MNFACFRSTSNSAIESDLVNTIDKLLTGESNIVLEPTVDTNNIEDDYNKTTNNEQLQPNESLSSSPTNGTNKKSKNITWQQPVTVGSPAKEIATVVVKDAG